MPIRRMALAVTVAVITLSPVATATPFPPASQPSHSLPDYYAHGGKPQTHFTPKPYDRYYGIDRTVPSEKAQTHFIPKPAATATAPVRPNPDNRAVTAVAHDLRSPDAIDAARAGQIARQLRHYHPQPSAVAEEPAPSHGPDWPPIAFGVAVLLTAAGAFAGTRIRSRRSSRIAA
jgi:hypothetical protein